MDHDHISNVATILNPWPLGFFSCVCVCVSCLVCTAAGGRILPFPLSHLTTIAAARKKKKETVFAGASKLSTALNHIGAFMLCQFCEGRIGPVLQAVCGMRHVFASNSQKQAVQSLLHNKSVLLRGPELESTCRCIMLSVPKETVNSNSFPWFFFSFFDPPSISHTIASIPFVFPSQIVTGGIKRNRC